MKILKEGIPATAVISCPHCKCEMEYNNSDLHEEITYDDAYYRASKSISYYIKCPCCGKRITVRKL